MDNGEAARISLAVGVLVDWIARTDERLYKLEQALGMSKEEADTQKARCQHEWQQIELDWQECVLCGKTRQMAYPGWQE